MKPRNTPERIAAYKLAGARAMLLHGPSACLSDALIQEHLPDGERAPLTKFGLSLLHGGVSGCWGRVKEGEVLPDDRLAPWTPGFFLGLKLSGALVRSKVGRIWFVYSERDRGWLEEDLGRMSPISGRLSKPYPGRSSGTRRNLSRCPAADLPCGAGGTLGLDVAVGILAGARTAEEDGFLWLRVPSRCSEPLKAWGMPIKEDGQGGLLVSPFWGALLSPLMPPALRAGHVGMSDRCSVCRKESCSGCSGRVGGCPLLPSVLWGMAMSGEFGRWMTLKGELPFGKPWDWWRFGEGLRAGDLPGKGLEMGMTRVRPEVRELMVGWRRAFWALRRKSSEIVGVPVFGGETGPGEGEG
jgi:hypothetical protein